MCTVALRQYFPFPTICYPRKRLVFSTLRVLLRPTNAQRGSIFRFSCGRPANATNQAPPGDRLVGRFFRSVLGRHLWQYPSFFS